MVEMQAWYVETTDRLITVALITLAALAVWTIVDLVRRDIQEKELDQKRYR